MIDGNTRLIAHLGYPTATFKAPMIYNPYFRASGINAVVVPMGVRPEDFEASLRAIFRFSNIHGALITMPHKVRVVPLLDTVSTAVKVAGACNAVVLRPDGTLAGDLFDGEGFVRGVLRKGQRLRGGAALVLGAGGVGSAIAAALAQAGVTRLALYDVSTPAMEGLATRLRHHFPDVAVATGSNDPAGHDLIVNATPMGMHPGDPLPLDISRLAPGTFVGEVVMKGEMTPFLAAAQARGCTIQIGLDMLFEQIPAYLEFFQFPTTTPERLRETAEVTY